MASGELRDYATVVTAIVALLVFALNSYSQFRNGRIANLARFFEAHQRLFAEDGYLATNIAAIESGTLVRDRANRELETKFHLMLLEIEQLAILANNRAVPRHTQVYMFGSYTRQLLGVITEQERNRHVLGTGPRLPRWPGGRYGRVPKARFQATGTILALGQRVACQGDVIRGSLAGQAATCRLQVRPPWTGSLAR